jgi:hypothetical protein
MCLARASCLTRSTIPCEWLGVIDAAHHSPFPASGSDAVPAGRNRNPVTCGRCVALGRPSLAVRIPASRWRATRAHSLRFLVALKAGLRPAVCSLRRLQEPPGQPPRGMLAPHPRTVRVIHDQNAETHIPGLAKHTAATHCRYPQPEPWEGCSYVDSRGSRLCGTAGQEPMSGFLPKSELSADAIRSSGGRAEPGLRGSPTSSTAARALISRPGVVGPQADADGSPTP